MNDKLKKIIFEKLNTDLSKVEIIAHNESIWFIDRENKYWCLEFVKSGKLYWRYQFFTQFFDLFTLDRERFEPLIKEWVESILNSGVVLTKTYSDGFNPKVEAVLNNRITTTAAAERNSKNRLEDTLNNGVTSTHEIVGLSNDIVDSVLNNSITSTEVEFGVFRNEIVEDVLNNGITSMSKHSHPLGLQVSVILSNSITSSRPAKKSITIVDSVLNNE